MMKADSVYSVVSHFGERKRGNGKGEEDIFLEAVGKIEMTGDTQV